MINHPQRGDVKSHTCDHKSMLIEGLYLYVYIHGATMRENEGASSYPLFFCFDVDAGGTEDARSMRRLFINLVVITE